MTTCNTELQIFYKMTESNRLPIYVEKINALLFIDQKLPSCIGDLLLNNQKMYLINYCELLGNIDQT